MTPEDLQALPWDWTGTIVWRGALRFRWLGGHDEAGGRCFACGWISVGWLKVEHETLADAWSVEIRPCRRHLNPDRWRQRVWLKAQAQAVKGGRLH